MPSDFRPRLIGRHDSPPSSVRNAPAAEMAANIRPGLTWSSRMVCRHIPPAPGCQDDAEGVGAQRRQFLPRSPPSDERKIAAS